METAKPNIKQRILTIRKFHIAVILSTTLILIQTSCKKIVEVGAPVTSTNGMNVYTNDATAIAVMTGIYSNLSAGTGVNFVTGSASLSVVAGLSSDELTLYGGAGNVGNSFFYSNELSATTMETLGPNYWTSLYNYVFKCNAAIEGMDKSNALTAGVKQQLMGEAKFVRGFLYFYLVNLFGDVPLVITSDFAITSTLPRISKEQVYEQILADLKEAEMLLSTDYLNGNLQSYTGTKERVRPTVWAAKSLLARVYLYIKDYRDAELETSAVINNTSLYNLSALNSVFLKNSSEAIWQLQPVNVGRNTEDARVFIIPATGLSNSTPVYLSNSLLSSFENGDQRKDNGNWVNNISITNTTYFYPYKYKINVQNSVVTSPGLISEYLTVLRLGEQYLIRAEARAQQNNISGAQSDLNTIRTRAGLRNTTANDKASLLNAILHERQVEFFTEWGHRWFDLKRTGNIDSVMKVVTPLKANGATWQSYQQLYPIPQVEISRNPNLMQNAGY